MQHAPGRNAHVHPAFRSALAVMSGEAVTVPHPRTAANDAGLTEAELQAIDRTYAIAKENGVLERLEATAVLRDQVQALGTAL